jgi:glycosyltransferase involved in cell wall biosynthesis
VIPCYNVAGQIAGVLEAIPEYVDGIVAVDDASPDRSYDVLTASSDRRLDIVRHEQNRGVGGAMITGFARAAELGAEILVKIDGDGQMDLCWSIISTCTRRGIGSSIEKRSRRCRSLACSGTLS